MNDSAIFGMLGLLIGGAGAWAVMRARFERAWAIWGEQRADIKADVRYYRDCSKGAHAMLREAEDAHSRLSDAHNTQSARIERAREYCDSNFRVRGEVVAAILTGERK